MAARGARVSASEDDASTFDTDRRLALVPSVTQPLDTVRVRQPQPPQSAAIRRSAQHALVGFAARRRDALAFERLVASTRAYPQWRNRPAQSESRSRTLQSQRPFVAVCDRDHDAGESPRGEQSERI